ncbi:MAG: SufE family protein [Hyphomicrobiales bacterium]
MRKLDLTGDSDALIVKGLIAIAFMIFAPLPLERIAATDAQKIFAELGLKEHLTCRTAQRARLHGGLHQGRCGGGSGADAGMICVSPR